MESASSTAPSQSNARGARPETRPGMNTQPITSPSAAVGRLSQNTACQEKLSTSTPPSAGPVAGGPVGAVVRFAEDAGVALARCYVGRGPAGAAAALAAAGEAVAGGVPDSFHV